MRQIVLDTETTGMDHKRGNRIIEIGAIELIDRKPTGRTFHYYVNPEGQAIEPGALAVHKITEESLRDKPTFKAIADEFIDFIRGAELLIHNADFDTGFLNMELAKLNKGTIWEIAKVECTLKMATSIYPGKRNSLDVLCDRHEIDRSARVAHGALLDAELLADVYIKMTDAAPPFVDDVAIANAERDPIVRVERSRAPILVSVTDEDRAANGAYLDRLEKATSATSVWRQDAAPQAPKF